MLNSSYLFRFFNFVCKRYAETTALFDRFYRDSRIHDLLSSLNAKIGICLKGSFLGRIGRVNYTLDPDSLLEGSLAVRKVLGVSAALKRRFSEYLDSSHLAQYRPGKVTQPDLCGPRYIGMGIIIAVSVNLALSFLFAHKIGVMGYIIRSVLLALGIAYWLGDKQ